MEVSAIKNNKVERLKKIKKSDKVFSASKGLKRKLIFTLTVFILVLFSVTYMYVQISTLDKKISQQENQLEELKKTKISLDGEIEGIKNSTDIANEAKYKLGMVYPEDDQIIYIDVENENVKENVKDNVFLSPVISILKSFTN